MQHRRISGLLALVLATQVGCIQRLERSVSATPPKTVDADAPFLKAHLKNGDLLVFAKWAIDDRRGEVTGDASLYGADRKLVQRANTTVRFADVALYETNTVVTSPAVAALAIMTGITVAVGVACLTNPKACFGSCPTFYAMATDRGTEVLQAEGFSDAIAPALEKHDIDALWHTHPTDGHLTVRMTNEAYETHVVKQVDILAVPRPPGTRVVSTGETLWLASHVTAPAQCTASGGDCTELVRAVDGRERTSLTDAHDLAARETIDLTFDAGTAPHLGIVIAARQSLLTTFLLYQGLSYLGDTAARWLAALAGDFNGQGLQTLVGGIEVQIPEGEDWRTVSEIFEVGPLATDVHLVALPAGVRADRIRLRLQQGGWRIDHVALVTLEREVTPQRIAPRRIRGTLGAEFAGGRTVATGFPLVTMPGDAYELEYAIPKGDVELFLDSRGYYTEWMRAEWIREQNPLAALRMFLDPAGALRDLAPAFKQLEPDAESVFWRSRYAHP